MLSFVSLMKPRQQQITETVTVCSTLYWHFSTGQFCASFITDLYGVCAQITMYLLHGNRALQVKDGLEFFHKMEFHGKIPEIKNINSLWKYQCCEKVDQRSRLVLVSLKLKSCIRLDMKVKHSKSTVQYCRWSVRCIAFKGVCC